MLFNKKHNMEYYKIIITTKIFREKNTITKKEKTENPRCTRHNLYPKLFHMSISVKIVQDKESLQHYSREWETLLSDCPSAAPTQSYAWISAMLSHDIPSDCPWYCLFAFADSRLVGLWMLIFESERKFGPIRIKRFRNLYSGFHTTHVDALVMKGYEQALVAMYRALKKHTKAIPIVASKAIAMEGGSLSAIQSLGNVFLQYKISSAYHEDVLEITQSPEQYFSTLKSKFRREIHRQERNMGALGTLRYEIGTTVGVDDPLSVFLDLEHSGWKGREGTSIRAHLNDEQLFSEAVQEFEKHSMVHWAFLYIGDKAVAGQLGVVVNAVLYLWKVGYRQEYATMGPGNVLLYRVLEQIHQTRQYRKVSFMNERSWLSPFQPTKQQLVDCTIYRAIPFL